MDYYVKSPEGYVFHLDFVLMTDDAMDLEEHGCKVWAVPEDRSIPDDLRTAIADSHGISFDDADADQISCSYTWRDEQCYFTDYSDETVEVSTGGWIQHLIDWTA